MFAAAANQGGIGAGSHEWRASPALESDGGFNAGDGKRFARKRVVFRIIGALFSSRAG